MGLMKPLIVAFEGSCLSGKTTLIQQLKNALQKSGISVFVVPEYTDVAGGHANLPSIAPTGLCESIRNAGYLVLLEESRHERVRRWTNCSLDSHRSVVLVDRTLLTCLELKKYLRDEAGQEVICEAFERGVVIAPDILFFLMRNKNDFKSRLTKRVLFKGWEIAYRELSSVVFSQLSRKFFTSEFVICQSPIDATAIYKQITQRIK